LAVAAIAVALVLAPSAPALILVQAEGTSLGQGVYAGTARCPPGAKVISGGFSTSQTDYVIVNRAQRKTGWFAKARDATDLTILAYCSRRLEASRASRTAKFPLASDGIQRNAVARCDQGKAVAGGWSFLPTNGAADNQPVFESSRRGADRWAVGAFNHLHSNVDVRDRIKAFVYCLRGVRVAVRRDASPMAGEDDAAAATADCEPGEEVLGGGYSTSPEPDFFNLSGPDFFYYVSAHGSQTVYWTAAAWNYSLAEGAVTSLAICRT
jgi:hypothetical protein